MTTAEFKRALIRDALRAHGRDEFKAWRDVQLLAIADALQTYEAVERWAAPTPPVTMTSMPPAYSLNDSSTQRVDVLFVT